MILQTWSSLPPIQGGLVTCNLSTGDGRNDMTLMSVGWSLSEKYSAGVWRAEKHSNIPLESLLLETVWVSVPVLQHCPVTFENVVWLLWALSKDKARTLTWLLYVKLRTCDAPVKDVKRSMSRADCVPRRATVKYVHCVRVQKPACGHLEGVSLVCEPDNSKIKSVLLLVTSNQSDKFWLFLLLYTCWTTVLPSIFWHTVF